MSDIRGLVIRSTGSWYSVKTGTGQVIDCRLRGKFRLDGMKTTNPIAVGDYVQIHLNEEKTQGSITEIESRRNCVIRKATRMSKQKHIIASNIDLSVLIATVAFPRTSTGFIDRFLVSSEAYNVEPIIVFNKIDLYNDALNEVLLKYTFLYENAGYRVLHISAKEGTNLIQLHHQLKGKVSLLSGHSGVGKSFILNALFKNLNVRTGEISDYHMKGKHTTTFAEMLIPEPDVWLIDTPGIKEFGLVDFEPWELGHWFPEFRRYIPHCRYNNCTHLREPDCAVRDAVDSNIIPPARYYSYLSILNNVEDQDD